MINECVFFQRIFLTVHTYIHKLSSGGVWGEGGGGGRLKTLGVTKGSELVRTMRALVGGWGGCSGRGDVSVTT